MKYSTHTILASYILTIFLLLFVFSCSDNKENSTTAKKPEPTTTALDDTRLDISNVIVIDSSDFVMYPLILENQVDVLGIKSSDNENIRNFWNIIFYNTHSGERHLLDEKRKMVINPSLYKTSNGFRVQIIENRIFYLITVKDFNNDGYLNSEDPAYLFVSETDGRNFGQVSPDNLHVKSWNYIPGSKKIFLQTIRDYDNDQEFEDTDDIIPLVYEIGSVGFAKDVFSREYKTEIKKLLLKQWNSIEN